MTAGFILDAVLDKKQHIAVVPELCKRVRFRKSTCQTCVDVCPENAITLSPGPVINDNCSNCGLCQNACPTEVFQNDVDTNQLLLQQVEALFSQDLDIDPAADNQKRLFIHCSQAEKEDKNSLAIHCLGNISENFFLGAAFSGLKEVSLKEVSLTKGHCSQCHLKNGEALLTNSITTSQAIVENMGLEAFSLRLNEAQKDNDAPLSRRELFSKISQRITADDTPTPSSQVDEALEMKDGKRVSPRRKMLSKLIIQNEQDNTSVNISQQTFPWKKMKVDEANCVACAICVNVCPTGALTKVFENNQVIRHLNNSLCTNCNLCQEACPEQVISFEENYTVTDLIEDKTYVVARIDMTSCAICGEINPARHGEICATCEKRQVAPMFMNN